MTQQRDFDRLARAWLDIMPSEAPDRVVASVLQAVEVTPQRRQPLRPASWRFPPMNRVSLTAVFAVVVAVVVGGALLFQPRPASDVGVSPSPPSSTNPPSTSSTQASRIPDALRRAWVGEPRNVPGAGPYGRMALNFGESSAAVSGAVTAGSSFASDASIDGAGHVRLLTRNEHQGCPIGQAGTYSFALSPTGKILTLTAVDEACATRAAVVGGTWISASCKPGFNPNPPALADCYGDLEAGTYKSRFIDFRVPEDQLDPSRPNYGGLTYTVPDGWANAADEGERLILIPSADYAQAPFPDGWWGLFAFAQPLPASKADGCPDEVEPSVGHSATELMTWLVTHPGVAATTPKPITIGGRPALWTDAHMKSSWKRGCSWAPESPYVPLFRSNSGVFGVNADTQRFVLVDIGGGAAALINVGTTDPNRFETFAAQSMPIMETFKFK